MKKSIGILGAGNVGEAVGLAFRDRGHDVCFYDVCREKAERHGYRDFRNLVKECEIIYECIPTESLPDGGCDLSILRKVIEQVAECCQQDHVFVQMSTCVPGTARTMSKLIPCHYVVNPSNLRMASRFQDAANPWKVILGVKDDYSTDVMRNVYWWVDPKDMFIGTYEFAETAKYADNCMQVTLIVFWNAMRKFTEEMGCFPELEKIIYALENTEALSTCGRYPGGAYGGPCFPKDVLALNRACQDMGGRARLLEMFTGTLHSINRVLKDEKTLETPAQDLWQVVNGKVFLTKEIS